MLTVVYKSVSIVENKLFMSFQSDLADMLPWKNRSNKILGTFFAKQELFFISECKTCFAEKKSARFPIIVHGYTKMRSVKLFDIYIYYFSFFR